MLFPGRTENEEIVKVDEKEGKGTEKGVHETLESLGGVFETKWHEIKLEKTKGVIIAVFGMSSFCIGT